MRKNVAFLLLFFCVMYSHAQSNHDLDLFYNRFSKQSEEFSKNWGNIFDMTKELQPDLEYDRAMRNVDSMQHFDTTTTTLLSYATLLMFMKNADDRKMVKKFFNITCNTAIREGRMAVESSNSILVNLKNKVLIDEIRLARDKITEMVATLDYCTK